jgi:DNA repair photolyase
MQTLYTPKGAAAVYAELAVNIYHECSHGCRYCYCPRIMHEPAWKFYAASPLPREGLLKDLEKACEEWAGVTDERPFVHLSFIGDPLPRDAHHDTTNSVIRALHRWGFPVQLLSKSAVVGDETLSLLSERDRYWITLTTMDANVSAYWEPFAGKPEERIAALQAVRHTGAEVGCSLEPVIDLDSVNSVLMRLTELQLDTVWIGPLNHIARGYDWRKLKSQLKRVVRELGLKVRWKDEACPTRRSTAG